MCTVKAKNKIEELDAAAVAEKLKEMTLLDCTELLNQNGIDGKRLLTLTELEFWRIFHDIPLGDKVKLWKYIEAVQRNPELFFGGSSARPQVNRSSSFASAREMFRNLERLNASGSVGRKTGLRYAVINCKSPEQNNNTRCTTKSLHQEFTGNQKQCRSQVEIPDNVTMASSSGPAKVQVGNCKSPEKNCDYNNTTTTKGLHQELTGNKKQCRSQVKIPDNVTMASLSGPAIVQGPSTNQTGSNEGSTEETCTQVELSDDDEVFLSSSSQPANKEGPEKDQPWQNRFSANKQQSSSQVEISDGDEYDSHSTMPSLSKPTHVEGRNKSSLKSTSQVEIQDNEVDSRPTNEEASPERYLPSPKISAELAPPRPTCPKPVLNALRPRGSLSQREIVDENDEELLRDYEIVQGSEINVEMEEEYTNEKSEVMEYDLLVSNRVQQSNDRPISGKYQPPPEIPAAPKGSRENIDFSGQKWQTSKFYVNDEERIPSVAQVSNPYENVKREVSQESSYGYEAEPQVNRTLMDAISDERYKPQPILSESVRHLGPHIPEKPRRGSN